jgi:hypothetical protein
MWPREFPRIGIYMTISILYAPEVFRVAGKILLQNRYIQQDEPGVGLSSAAFPPKKEGERDKTRL